MDLFIDHEITFLDCGFICETNRVGKDASTGMILFRGRTSFVINLFKKEILKFDHMYSYLKIETDFQS